MISTGNMERLVSGLGAALSLPVYLLAPVYAGGGAVRPLDLLEHADRYPIVYFDLGLVVVPIIAVVIDALFGALRQRPMTRGWAARTATLLGVSLAWLVWQAVSYARGGALWGLLMLPMAAIAVTLALTLHLGCRRDFAGPR